MKSGKYRTFGIFLLVFGIFGSSSGDLYSVDRQ
jgi:hypothetical protein